MHNQAEPTASPQQQNGSPQEADRREENTIVIENEALRKGFTLIPNSILRDAGLSFGARLAYTLLLSYAWQEGSCFPGQDKIGSDLGVTRKAVNKYLKELKDKQYIAWQRRGMGKTNVYYILDRSKQPTPPSGEPEPDNSRSGKPSSDVTIRLHQDVTAGSHPDVTERYHNKYPEEKDAEEQQPVVVQKLASLHVKQSKIEALIARYSPQYIQEKLDLLRWKRKHGLRGTPIVDSAAWVVKAIENDYKPPPEFAAWRARQQKTKEQIQQLTQWEKQQKKDAEQAKVETERAYQQGLKKLKSAYRTSAQEQRRWEQALEFIKDFTDPTTYRFWFPNTHLLAIRDGMVTLAVPNTVTKKRLENQHASLILRALSSVVDTNQDLKVQAIVPSPD